MKKIYFLFLLTTVFGFNLISAEPCPESAIITNSGLTLIVTYTTINCPGMPASVTVGANTYDTPICLPGSNLAIYALSTGTAPADTGTLTIDAGFDTVCNYSDSVLPIGDFEFLNATFKVYPNPLLKDNQLNVKFAINATAKIYMYDVTGKLAVADEINNANSKQINTSALTNGVYFLRMVTENTTITKKVIVMK